ncbi:MAG: SWIM zinc finger family protein [Dehalococcoidia bacterium]
MLRLATSATVRARAAALVNADAVSYTGATSSGSAAFDVAGYRVTVERAACRVEDCRCNCRWGQHGGGACSHVRAVRLAWARAAMDYRQRRRAERAAAIVGAGA